METVPLILSVALGISLAASCGLRAFLPLFVAALVARWGGEIVPLGESFAWLQSTPALVALGVAVLLETAADKVPAVDHLLDLVQVPVRTGAEMLVCAAVMGDVPAWLTALLAVVLGGGAALSVHSTKSAIRLGSTATTGGAANPLLSLLEDGVCLLSSLLSVFLWGVALLIAFGVLIGVIFVLRAVLRRRRAAPAPAP